MRSCADHGAWVALGSARRTRVEDVSDRLSAVNSEVAERVWSQLDPVLAGSVVPDPESPAVCKHCDFRGLCREPYRGDEENQSDA